MNYYLLSNYNLNKVLIVKEREGQMKRIVFFLIAVLTCGILFTYSNYSNAKPISTKYFQMKDGYTFVAMLSGKNEVPSINSKASGKAVITFSEDGKQLHYKITLNNIDSVFAAHIHIGSAKQNGPIAVVLYNDQTTGKVNGALAEGTVASKDLIGPMEGKTIKDLEMAVEKGNAYINVHTNENQSGEVRGQLEKK